MKKLLLLTVIVCTTFACSKDEESDIINQSSATCSIDGESKTFTLLNSYSGGALAFANDLHEEVGFTGIPSPIPSNLPVTYKSDTDTIVAAVYTINDIEYGAYNMGDELTLGSYELTISKNDDSKISGTFSMTVYNIDNLSDSVVITNGVFTDIAPLNN